MTVRNPQFDFTTTDASWAPNHEFAQSFNAFSTLFPPLERFLNRVMTTARSEITGDDKRSQQLREDIDLFRRQEGVHYRIHDQFNAMLVRCGYEGVVALEADMERQYRELIATKSLKFLTGYCEGFEILGPIYASVWLDEFGDFFDGADPEVVAMWKWHICEEYEHRTVCYDVFHHLFRGYFYRLYTMRFCSKHQGAYIKRVMGYLISQDWKAMTEAEVAASMQRLEEVGKRMKRDARRRKIQVFLPFYSPRRAPVPRTMTATLAAIEQTYVTTAA